MRLASEKRRKENAERSRGLGTSFVREKSGCKPGAKRGKGAFNYG